MQYYTIEELKAKIVAGLDLIQLLDVLDITFVEMVDRLEDIIEERYEDLVAALGEEPYL